MPHRSALRAAAAVSATLFAALPMMGGGARAADLPTLEIRQHRFVPDRIEVPARVKFTLKVHNSDDAADEFESSTLHREKLVPAGGTITLFLGPLEPGEYHFFSDFHQDTGKGVLVAK